MTSAGLRAGTFSRLRRLGVDRLPHLPQNYMAGKGQSWDSNLVLSLFTAAIESCTVGATGRSLGLLEAWFPQVSKERRAVEGRVEGKDAAGGG